MKSSKTIRIILFGISFLTTLSLLSTTGLGRKLFQLTELRQLLDVIMLVSLGINLYEEWKTKRSILYWIAAFTYMTCLTLDTIVWFHLFIPEAGVYNLHLALMSLPIPIYLYFLLKDYRRSIVPLLIVGFLTLAAGFYFSYQLELIYKTKGTPDISYDHLLNLRLVANYTLYVSILSFITTAALVFGKKYIQAN